MGVSCIMVVSGGICIIYVRGIFFVTVFSCLVGDSSRGHCAPAHAKMPDQGCGTPPSHPSHPPPCPPPPEPSLFHNRHTFILCFPLLSSHFSFFYGRINAVNSCSLRIILRWYHIARRWYTWYDSFRRRENCRPTAEPPNRKNTTVNSQTRRTRS